MISSIFFLNHHGEVIIEKQFREKLSRTNLEDFWCTYMAPLCSIDEASAVIPYSRFAFVQIHRNDVVLLAIITSEGFPLLVMEMLSLIARVLQGYLKVFSESTLRENFSVVYQLLEELVHNGYPLTTEIHVLQDLVVPPTLENKFRTVLDAPAKVKRRHTDLHCVPWRELSTRHSSNEIFFDIVEHLDCIIDCEGNLLHTAVHGVVEVNCRLSGMPDILMRLSNLDSVDDIAFHRCVRRNRYELDRTITFIPPDGKFTLLEYRCKPLFNTHPPFYVTPQITFDTTGGRFNCMVGLRGGAGGTGNFVLRGSREYEIHKVVIYLPLPPQTETVQVHSSTHGSTSFNKSNCILTWSVGTILRGTGSLSGEFTFGGEKNGNTVIPCTGDSARIEFSLPNYLLSSIRVDSVQILNEIEMDNNAGGKIQRSSSKESMMKESYEERFQRLSKIMESKTTRPPMNVTKKLELYGLWNQAMYGANTRPKPSRMSMVACAKWNAYTKYSKLSKEEAKKRFAEVAETVLAQSKL